MDFTTKTTFFEGWSCFKFDNLGLALGMALKFYINVTKGLKLKTRTFWGLIPIFVKVTRKKTGRGPFCPHPLSWVGKLKNIGKTYGNINF